MQVLHLFLLSSLVFCAALPPSAAVSPLNPNVMMAPKPSVSTDVPAILNDVTGVVFSFWDSLGSATKTTFDKLTDGIETAVSYVESFIGGLIHGGVTNSAGSHSLGPFYQVITLGSNLAANALAESDDPSSLLSPSSAKRFVKSLSELRTSVLAVGLDTGSLDDAISRLSKYT